MKSFNEICSEYGIRSESLPKWERDNYIYWYHRGRLPEKLEYIGKYKKAREEVAKTHSVSIAEAQEIMTKQEIKLGIKDAKSWEKKWAPPEKLKVTRGKVGLLGLALVWLLVLWYFLFANIRRR